MELRRTTRDRTGPDGRPTVGRGYEVCDEQGAPVPQEALRPPAFDGIAVVDVSATAPEEHQAMTLPAFAVDRAVTLRVRDNGIAVFDADGAMCAGWLPQAQVEATASLLSVESALSTWVCWQWLREEGRTAIQVALSRPDLAPQRLGQLAHSTHGSARRMPSPRVLLGIAAAVVLIVAVVVSCT